MNLSAVLIRHTRHGASADARFALRDVLRHAPAGVRVILGAETLDAHELLTGDPDGRVLVLRSPLLSLEARCLARLEQALATGLDAAQASDSGQSDLPVPPDYATVRGMERYADRLPGGLRAPVGDPLVALTTQEGLRRQVRGAARVARVSDAWAHDASGYFSGDRAEVVPLIPAHARRLLDVGGGEGAFLSAAKRLRPDLSTTLVELTADAAAAARARGDIDAVEQVDFLHWAPGHRFDCITFLDVLEHMQDPEQALLRARALLAPGGELLLSIPNVGHASVIADLLEGRWDWAPAGIHCYTHLRFFTRTTIEHMLQRCGLQASLWMPVPLPAPAHWLEGWRRTSGLAVQGDAIDTYAYIMRAAPC